MQHSIPSSTATKSHLYAPLNPATPEIRVVKLLPSEEFSAPIQCQLFNRPLYQEDGCYETLSYVWGPQEFVAEILLDGEPRLITRNLQMALRYLRLPKSQRTIWVDAICINQNDPIERGQQVRLMREIYANCEVDLAWMLSYDYTLKPPEAGLDGDSSDEDSSFRHPTEEQQLQKIHDTMERIGAGMELMKKISLKDALILDEMKAYAKSSRVYFDESQANGRLFGTFGSRPSSKVDAFLLTSEHAWVLSPAFQQAPIFNRVWTMQELSLAPRVVLIAGHHQLDWGHVEVFLGETAYADAFHDLFGHGHLAKALHRQFAGAQKVDHQRRITRRLGSESTLLDVLARFQSNRATDPRDRIYGLLGLVTDAHDIVIDYNKSAAQVFMDTTVSLINKAGNLDMLCQTIWTTSTVIAASRLGSGVTGLPTWAANFSLPIASDEHSRLLFAQRGIYGAAKLTIDTPCKIINSNLLQLRAIILGHVQQDIVIQGPRQTWENPHYLTPHRWLKDSGIETFITERSNNEQVTYKQTNEIASRAYWRTLLMDCSAYPITRLTSDEILAGDSAFQSIVQDPEKEHTQDNGGYSRGKTAEPQDPNDSILTESLARHWDKLPESMRCMWTRNYRCWTFSITDNGLYIMIQNALAGDVIASVEGAKVPLVLREKGEFQGNKTYDLVGSAYVHGFMDGEALVQMTEFGLEEEQILVQ